MAILDHQGNQDNKEYRGHQVVRARPVPLVNQDLKVPWVLQDWLGRLQLVSLEPLDPQDLKGHKDHEGIWVMKE